MSGGHWDYNNNQIKEFLMEIGRDRLMTKRFPKLVNIFNDLGLLFDNVIHELDWDFSSDSSIDDDKEFEIETIKKIQKIIGVADLVGNYQLELEKLIEDIKNKEGIQSKEDWE